MKKIGLIIIDEILALVTTVAATFSGRGITDEEMEASC